MIMLFDQGFDCSLVVFGPVQETDVEDMLVRWPEIGRWSRAHLGWLGLSSSSRQIGTSLFEKASGQKV